MKKMASKIITYRFVLLTRIHAIDEQKHVV